MSWPKVSLETLCYKITDGSHNPPKGIDDSAYLMLSSKNIFHDEIHFESPRFLSQEDFEQENKRTDVCVNDVLLTIVGTVGRAAVVLKEHPKFVLQRSVAVLKPIVGSVTPRYLMYSLQSLSNVLTEEARGVAQKGIYLKQIREFQIPLPPLEVQKKIAAILDAADVLRQKDQQLIDKYNALSQSLFLDMFGTPVPCQLNQDKYAVSSIHKFRWVTIGDICQTTQGVQITKANTSSEPYDGSERYLYIADFIGDKSLSFVDDKFDAKKVSENDLVMANTGSPGRVFKGKDGILSNNLFKISFNRSEVNRDYLFAVLSSKEFQHSLQQQMKGGIQKHLGHKTISRQSIPLPPIAFQDKFAEFVEAVEAQEQQAHAALNKSGELFNSLLQRAFKGELTA